MCSHIHLGQLTALIYLPSKPTAEWFEAVWDGFRTNPIEADAHFTMPYRLR